MFVVNNLSTRTLKPVSLIVASGECISIEGASGSGKTILLRALADLDETAGDVRLNGVERCAMSGPQWRSKVRFVAAEPGFWADTVGEHFNTTASVGAQLEKLDLPAEAIDWRIERLSTGEKQRVGLTLALVDSPPLILADEPTSALDAEASTLVENLLIERLKSGAAIILVSHDSAFARRISHRHFLIHDGELSEQVS
jgi:ABC-type glutathione transport system ATPase component